MSEENKTEEKPKPVLYRELLAKQVDDSEKVIVRLRQQASSIAADIEKNLGVLHYAKFLLERYDLPLTPPEPTKEEVK